MGLVCLCISEVIAWPSAPEVLRCLQLGSFTGLSQNPQHDCDWKEQIQRIVAVRGTFGDDSVQGL